MSCSELMFFVNGCKVIEKAPDPEWTLLFYLREKLRLCGTKLGCGEGGCGACTVMVSMYDKESSEIKHISANACLAPVCAMHGLAVTTVEGIGSTRKKLHTVQERMAKMHASQCGFCTPGIVMSMYTMLRNKPKPETEDLEDYLKGNLCRCTGYRPILESMKTLCAEKGNESSAIESQPLIRNVNVDGKLEHAEEEEIDLQQSNRLTTNGYDYESGMGEQKSELKDCREVEMQNGQNDAKNNLKENHALLYSHFTDEIVKEACQTAKEDQNLLNGIRQPNGEGECCGAAEGCCRKTLVTNSLTRKKSNQHAKSSSLIAPKFAPYDPSQEPIFPPSLLLIDQSKAESLLFKGETVTWYRPSSLDELLDLKSQFREAKIVVGNTEIGLETKFKHLQYPVLIHTSHVDELNIASFEDYGIKFGASVTLDKIEKACRKAIKEIPEYKTGVLSALVEMMQWFAGKQIRYVASIGGNIMTGSPISDLNPIFLAAKCRLEVASVGKRRSIKMNERFYLGYRKTCLKPEEVLLSITIPFTKQNEFFQAFKQSKRRDDDIAIVNAAFRMLLQENLVQDVSLCYGGLAPTTKLALETMKLLYGTNLREETLGVTLRSICAEFDLPPDAPGGMVRYRRSLALSLFFKFFVNVAEKINLSLPDMMKPCPSAAEKFKKRTIKSHQFFKIADDSGEKREVGKPMPHKSGELHTTGEAVYVDDMVKRGDELELVFLLSQKAHAKIINIDPSKALLIEGVEDFVCFKDLPLEKNKIGIHELAQDEEVFASEKVHCIGQVIGAILARSKDIARRAAREVKVSYEELPAIITIEEAIETQSFFENCEELRRGDLEKAFQNCDHVMEGAMRTGAQEHFYLETQACIAFPLNENDEMVIYASTQAPSDLQRMVANALGVDHNRVVCKTKRLGGGFGGKESRSCFLAVAVAVAANKVGKPVRMMLDRNEDMMMTGYRHPFLSKYKVGFNNDGSIKAFDIDLFANAGWSLDLSVAVAQQSVIKGNNSYDILNWRSSSKCCQTNLPSNTAFRGFGAFQGMAMTENCLHDVATILNKDPAEIRQINMYQGGELTHYNQIMEPGLKRCWDQCMEESNYYKMKEEIRKFNDTSRWKKRGIAILPVTFGIGFDVPFLNRGAALLHVYLDGSVLLTHGGVEMGQGLQTKMIQVASTALQIPPERIFTSHVATDKVPNTVATVASASSDLNGMAVIDACNKLLKRLEPYKRAGTKWEDWVKTAFFDRVSLSATGYHKTPDIGYDFKTNTGRPFDYYTFGVGCSVVEIDCLTGDNKILRTNIVMDLGESLNPAIDIGQIEGAFMQGYGMFVMEQMLHTPKGELLTFGPSTYKIPSFGDVPEEFNVSLLSGSSNVRAVYSSKAVGEPPLFLAASVFFAIKDAIGYARRDAGYDGIFKLEAPATAERIRLACEDAFTKMIPEVKEGTYEPWSIQV